MSEADSPADSVLEALGYALFVCEENGALRLRGRSPEWLRELWPSLKNTDAVLPIEEASPFFENFLIDAEECWREGGAKRVESGPWIEQRDGREDAQLDATALTAGEQRLLLLERLGAAFEAKKEVLQRAREVVIAHQRLNSEMQKKEILLHYVADEMTTALSNIVTSLRLMELEDNPPRTKILLGLAERGAQDQQSLINRVLEVFAEEIGGIYGREGGAQWDVILEAALEAAVPQFADKGVALIVPPARTTVVNIHGSAAQLQRVVLGLLQNALELSPAGGEVAAAFEEESDAICFRVSDQGPRISSDAYDDLFANISASLSGANPATLRLHFCRVMVESCGGEIGCGPGNTGGNEFWIRLPKADA